MTALEQQELLQAFKRGERAAFERVFRLFYHTLRVQAFLLLENSEDAEDQVQQLFLDLWNKELYRNVKDSLKSYLQTAVRNRCYNIIAARKQHRHFALEVIGEKAEEVMDLPDAEMQDKMKHALKQLPQQRFRAFTLVYLEEKKYLQAAKEMGISINSLKSHLKLAVKFLRLQIQK